jgi:perosamine synthetase
MKKIDEKLAINGGPKTINTKFAAYNSLGEEERLAVDKVMRSGVLSQFLGVWHKDFYGGPKVQEFEKIAAEYFGTKYAITVNSWTSGLIAAVGALDIEPGDEIIVSPWTMSASATAILHWNAIPIFADIEEDTFNLDTASVEANITPYTKAIMAVDIFGHSADMDGIRKIANKHNLKIISDTAQAPGAMYKGKHAGTLADIGGYSLNYHKHIHWGEGGIIVTNDDNFAERLQLIRNHAEVVVEGKGVEKLNNMVGYNFRLGEIESASGIEQLKKLKGYTQSREKIANRLSKGLSCLDGLKTPVVKDGCSHVYYNYPMIIDVEKLGCSKFKIADALRAEGVEVATAYQNIHLSPMYQKKIAFGNKGFPWTAEFARKNISYAKGICPVAEKLNDETYLGFGMCIYDLNDDDIDLVIKSFHKVWNNIDQLK